MTLIAILIVFALIIFICNYTDKQDVSLYGTEFYLKEIISNAEIKNLVIDLKGYVDD